MFISAAIVQPAITDEAANGAAPKLFYSVYGPEPSEAVRPSHRAADMVRRVVQTLPSAIFSPSWPDDLCYPGLQLFDAGVRCG
jgi:hypothetical protein